MSSFSTLSVVTRRLEGKVALITGGVSGIGESAVKLFSKHGAKVVIADVQDQLGHSVINEIGPENSTYIHCDVTNEDDVRNAVDKAVSTYGKLDIMYNNAGTIDFKPEIIDIEKKVFDRIMAINVTGVFLGMKHAARVMIPARRGAIISTASVAAHVGGTASHSYTGSKHAIVGLTKNLAVELGQYGIRVNCVSPFVVATELAKKYLKSNDQELVEKMTQDMGNLKGATLKADDVANAALFLASDDAKYVSGQNLFIDGGFTVCNSAMQVFKRN